MIPYTIGLLNDADQHEGLFRKPQPNKAKETLTSFALSPEDRPILQKKSMQVAQLCKSFAYDLRNQYMLGTSSMEMQMNPKNRDQVECRPGFKIHRGAKPGYCAPQRSPKTKPEDLNKSLCLLACAYVVCAVQ